MDDVNKMSVVDNLRRRIAAEKIYTSVGDILIALNPYKMLPLYTPQIIDEFVRRDPVDLPPHVFGIAMDSFRKLVADGKDQSILISGESGAGKTEATKQVGMGGWYTAVHCGTLRCGTVRFGCFICCVFDDSCSCSVSN